MIDLVNKIWRLIFAMSHSHPVHFGGISMCLTKGLNEFWCTVPGGEIKRDPEIGKTAMQPEPAQTADLSISGSRLISSLCIDLLPTIKS